MRLALALGAAMAAMTVAAVAQTGDRIIVRHHGAGVDIDANDDGWITRDEASAAADRMFADMDSNHDGRLNDADHAAFEREFDIRIAPPAPGAAVMAGENCTQTVDPPNAREGEQQRVTVICHDESGDAQTSDRTVTVIRRGEGGEWTPRAGEAAPTPPMPPIPPMPPHPPMAMMLFANVEESDQNGDGALSREEFRAQQLRFFEASDGNRDGRVRYDPPPEPPTPPSPPLAPTPPEPPRRH